MDQIGVVLRNQLGVKLQEKISAWLHESMAACCTGLVLEAGDQKDMVFLGEWSFFATAHLPTKSI